MRKKFFSLIVCLALLQSSATAAEYVNVFVNGRAVDTKGFLMEDTTYLPVRAICEAIGANVEWDGDKKSVNVTMTEEDKTVKIIEEASPSVVAIVGNYNPTYTTDDIDRYNDYTAHGTGVVIKSSGVILTNAHVVEDLYNITVVFADGKSYPGIVQNIDTLSDLALVKVDRLGLKPIIMGQSSDIVVGKSAIAIGTPLSLSMRNSATKGIISGKNVMATDSYYPLIQTDAAINPGNSGGPLLNMSGKLIGINSMKFSGIGIEGLSFSIPVETVKYVLEQFEKNGRVIRPDLKITLEESWEARIGLPTTKGLTVKYSQSTELVPGDMIVKINNQEVHSKIEYNMALRDTYKEGEVLVTAERNGEKFEVRVNPEMK